MQRVKKNKSKSRVNMTVQDLEREKLKIAKQMTERINLLYLTVLVEEFGFDETQIIDVLETVTRWAEYVDEKLVPLEKTKEIIERKTGFKITGWSER